MNQEFKAPEWMKGWKIFIVFSLISFALAFGLRCFDLPKWDNNAFIVNGEYIMATHDAYYWLAGAKGVGSAVGNPMSTLVELLGSVTGAQYGNIAFWLPAVFAGLTAVAAFAWGMLLSGPWSGVVAAVFATAVPSYYFRTRLGYYDTDVVTLLCPLLISVLIARWLKPGLRSRWYGGDENIAAYEPSAWEYALPVLAGGITSFGRLWHSDVMTFGVVVMILATGLALVCGGKGHRATLLRGVFIFALASFFGLAGFILSVLAAVACFSPQVRKQKMFNQKWAFLTLLVLLVALSGVGQSFVQVVSGKITAYLKPVADTVAGSSGPQYPGIAQSVIEAQNISFAALFNSLTGSEILGWFGFAGFAFALVMSPLSFLLAPFAGVTFAAVSMGGRFSMFGGVAIGLGASYALVWLCRKFVTSSTGRNVLVIGQALVLAVLLLSNNWNKYTLSPPTPIMNAAHVNALIESGKKMPKDSTVWTWWDWGYATMYYAGVNSFANGGHHGGKVLFPLGLALATPSYMQSNQVIKFSAANNDRPADVWDKMTAKSARTMLMALGTKPFRFPPVKDQYIVVSWENIRLAYWILYYGSWNVETGSGVHPNVKALMSAFDINFEQGTLISGGQTIARLSSYDVMRKNRPVHGSFPGSVGPHLIYNGSNSQAFLIDDFAYGSMLCRLLFNSPTDPQLSRYFKIVYDGYPNVRVYKII